MPVKLYFWYFLDCIVHRKLHLENKYVWAWQVCNKLAAQADKHDRWDLM